MRLSRGRSTPTSRAMCAIPHFCGGLVPVRSLGAGSGLRAGRWMTLFARALIADERRIRSVVLGFRHSVVGARLRSALALLVTRIGADHHDPPMPADHPALIANGLDARVHLHGC